MGWKYSFPTTNITYQLPQSGYVTIKIYNAIGQEKATLVNESQHAGTYKLNFNGTNL